MVRPYAVRISAQASKSSSSARKRGESSTLPVASAKLLPLAGVIVKRGGKYSPETFRPGAFDVILGPVQRPRRSFSWPVVIEWAPGLRGWSSTPGAGLESDSVPRVPGRSPLGRLQTREYRRNVYSPAP